MAARSQSHQLQDGRVVVHESAQVNVLVCEVADAALEYGSGDAAVDLDEFEVLKEFDFVFQHLSIVGLVHSQSAQQNSGRSRAEFWDLSALVVTRLIKELLSVLYRKRFHGPAGFSGRSHHFPNLVIVVSCNKWFLFALRFFLF